MDVERIAYRGWNHVYRITNKDVELWLVADVGPRILRYSFRDGPNMFAEFEEMLGGALESTWKARGGHRLWTAPETDDTYALDNKPVDVEEGPAGLTAIQPADPQTKLEKKIEIILNGTGTGVTVRHEIVNRGVHPKQVAPWALTMMKAGGVGLTGFPPRGPFPEFLLPTNPLVMWAYTDLPASASYRLMNNEPSTR